MTSWNQGYQDGYAACEGDYKDLADSDEYERRSTFRPLEEELLIAMQRSATSDPTMDHMRRMIENAGWMAHGLRKRMEEDTDEA